MIPYWSLSDNNSLEVSRTLLSNRADPNNAVVWVVSTRPFISKSSSLFITHLVSPSLSCLIAISIFCKVNLFILLFFQFHSVVIWDSKVHNSARFFFLWIIPRSKFLAEIWWSVYISKSQWSLRVSFSRRDSDSDFDYYYLFLESFSDLR